MKWAVDAMIGNVAKYLLILGEDVFYDPACFGTAIAGKCLNENRVLVTSGSRLLQDYPQIKVIYFNHSLKTIWDRLRYIKSAFNISFQESMLFSRCTMCNEPLIEINPAEKPITVPMKIFEDFQLYQCGKCKKFYWKGGHYSRTKQALIREKIL